MDELLSKFLWWFIWFLVIYAVGFLTVRTLLRRTVFRPTSQRDTTASATPADGKDGSLKVRERDSEPRVLPEPADRPGPTDSSH